MSTVTDADLKEIKDLIIANHSALETRLTGLETGQIEIKERLAIIETRFEDWKPSITKIPDLA